MNEFERAVVKNLQEQIEERKGHLDGSECDDFFLADIAALKYAIEVIQGKEKEAQQHEHLGVE